MTQTLSFEELRAKLALWEQTAKTNDRFGQTVLAVPSLSLPYFAPASADQILQYEERMLYLVHLLRDPRTQLIVVTSRPLAEPLVAYLLHLLPGVPYSHARRRLQLFHVHDDSRKPLTQKILERPALMHRLRGLLAKERRASISCYTVTDLEERLSVELQVPLRGPRAEHLRLATKSGSRRLFRALDMAHPLGSIRLHEPLEVVRRLVGLATEKPALPRAVLKHNYSLSGFGNAIVDLEALRERMQSRGLPEPEFLHNLAQDLPKFVRLAQPDQPWDSYWARFREDGGVAEEYIEGDPCSVQVRIGLDGSVDVISTHDELTGGPDQQTYVGCRFPASSRVARPLAEAGLKLGRWMAKEGLVGRFDADFLATPRGGSELDTLYALDVNLRKGNTTLPIRTLQLLTEGSYNPESGSFTDERGTELHYLSSDHFGSGQFRGMLPRDLLEIATYSGFHYSTSSHTGAVFHMLGGLSLLGQAGITCIERSAELAERLYYTVYQRLEESRGGFTWMT